MPPKKKSTRQPKQGPPISFRPGEELGQLVGTFAKSKGVGEHEAYKNLSALAIAGLDMRYYDLVAALAAKQPGVNPFVRAVLRLLNGLVDAIHMDNRYAVDPSRTQLLITIVKRELENNGGLSQELEQVLIAAIGMNSIAISAKETVDSEPEFQSIPRHDARNKQKVRLPN